MEVILMDSSSKHLYCYFISWLGRPGHLYKLKSYITLLDGAQHTVLSQCCQMEGFHLFLTSWRKKYVQRIVGECFKRQWWCCIAIWQLWQLNISYIHSVIHDKLHCVRSSCPATLYKRKLFKGENTWKLKECMEFACTLWLRLFRL